MRFSGRTCKQVLCNSVKNRKEFENNILDCTKEDVVYCMHYEWNVKEVKITPTNAEYKVEATAKLIEDVFNDVNTGLRKVKCEKRFNALKEEIHAFNDTLDKYNKTKKLNNSKLINRYKERIIAMMSRDTAFSAFKKWIIINKLKQLPEFKDYIDN